MLRFLQSGQVESQSRRKLRDLLILLLRSFFVAERFTVADIALYAYTHVADEGDFDLADFPAIRAWLARISSQPGHVPITYA